jgi:hypothetical protein
MSTALAGKDIAGEVLFLSRELKTPVIAATFATLGDQAREQGWSHEEYLAAVLGRQVASRAANGGGGVVAATIDRLVHHAHVIALDGDSYRTRAHRASMPPPATIKTTKRPSNQPKHPRGVNFRSAIGGSIFTRR